MCGGRTRPTTARGRETLIDADPTTILVVTPSMGGHYFGELLAGLTREVGGAGGRVVVVETLPESAPRD